ncbi:MAG TPA: four helix bundle protein [Candidatus Magasanikbacteria bacterium]|nr:four helix bundle protein [Candidatus Magasanikbacteria bacterium]
MEYKSKVISGFRDLDVYQRSYRVMKITMDEVVKKLPIEEKYNLSSQCRRACQAVPRLIAEGYAKRHQVRGFHKYIDDAMAESNEMMVSIEQVKDLYPEYVDIIICKRLILTYEVISKQLYRLAQSWNNVSGIPASSPKS